MPFQKWLKDCKFGHFIKYLYFQFHYGSTSAKYLFNIRPQMLVKWSEIPYTTLRHKLYGDSDPNSYGIVERPVILYSAVKEELITWIEKLSRNGAPLFKQDLLHSAKYLCSEYNTEIPFESLWNVKHSKYLSKANAAITEEYIRNWYRETIKLLGPERIAICIDPTRIFNTDETAVFVNSSGNLEMVERGKSCESCYSVSSSDKENITVSIIAWEDGKLTPLLAV